MAEKKTNWAEMPDQAWWGEYRYEMPRSLAQGLLSTAKKEEKVDPQKFLCDFVNRECLIKGHCSEVLLV